MRGPVIGKTMLHGYAGSYARQPDMVVDTHPLEGEEALRFGDAVIYGTAGAVRPFGAEGTADTFLGVAVKEIKSTTDFLNQNEGKYQPDEAVPVSPARRNRAEKYTSGQRQILQSRMLLSGDLRQQRIKGVRLLIRNC